MGKQYSAKWLNHFRRHANAARDSVKEVTKVGAVLVGNNNEVLLTAFNGPSIGVKDSPDRRSRTDGLKYKYSSHAERNLISFAARRGISTEGLTIYATHFPCSGCANAIVQAGISCVIVGHGEYKSADDEVKHSKRILAECNVQMIEHRGSYDIERADALARAVLFDYADENGESLYYQAVRAMNLIPDCLHTDYKTVALLRNVVNYLPATVVGDMFEDLSPTMTVLCDRGDDHIANANRIVASNNTMAILAELAYNRDNLDPARAWEIEEKMRPIFRDQLIPARKILMQSLHNTEVRETLKVWGIDTLYHSGFLVLNPVNDLPYVLIKKD